MSPTLNIWGETKMEFLTLDNLGALLALSALEIVLGIDNLVFIAVLVGKLPKALQAKARIVGLGLALIFRIGLLLSISWIIKLRTPLFEVMAHPFSGRDLILLGGGLFLLFKATVEIHRSVEGEGDFTREARPKNGFWGVITQIVVIDLVFSLDSVITAVGLAQDLWIMIVAIMISIVVMIVFADDVSRFIEEHPTLKILALSFLLLVGVFLTADGLGKHIPRGYIYTAMAFSLMVEFLNMRVRKKAGG